MNGVLRGLLGQPLVASTLLGLAIVACGSDPRGTGGLDPGDGLEGADDLVGDDSGRSDDGPAASGGASSGGLDAGGQCRALSLAEGCSGEVFEGEAAALDLLLVFDESGSMSTQVDEVTGETRLDIVRGALAAFLSDPESSGIGVGLSYFGHMPLGATSCSPADYEQLAVSFGDLPEHSERILDSLRSQEPTGETPTGAAIRAACSMALQHRKESPARVTSILLVTDGEPKAPLSAPDCEPTLADAVSAAEECTRATGLPIYVLGVGPSLQNLNRIAEAGDTQAAYLADLDNQEQVLDALQRIRVAAQIPCGFELATGTSGSELNYEASTVAYVDSVCTYAGISRVPALDGCEEDGRGYYFDDPDQPARIDLCPATCAEVRAQGKQLFYSAGCPLDVDVYK